MLRSILIISALVVGQPGIQPPNPSNAGLKQAVLKKQVSELVLQLNAFQLKERQAAEQALVKLGPAVLPYLPRTSSRTPAEVRQRLARVLQAVESVAAKESVESRKVTLEGKFALKDVFAELEKQTGNRVAGFEDLSSDVEVEFKEKPYWRALDEVLDKAGLTVNAFSQDSGILTVMAKPDGQIDRVGRADYAGLFRYEAIRIQSVRDLINPDTENMRIAIGVAWEPRLTPISLSQPFDKITATDENGDEIELTAEGRQDVAVNPGMSRVEVELPFPLPDRNVKKIKSLKGEMLAMLPGRVERFEFTRLQNASNQDQRRAGVTVTLERVRKAEALYKFWIRVKFDDASNALESYRGWILRNEAYLVAPGGEKIVPASLETTLQSDNEVGIAYYFDRDDGLDGCRFRYETPALIIQLPVKFELKDIDLP